MRIIKFRAWDGKKMHKVGRLGIEGFTHDLILKGSACGSRIFDSVKIMEFSGLTDRTGTEIYEGDILDNGILTLPVSIDGAHGFCFMFGKEHLTRADSMYGVVVGHIFDAVYSKLLEE